MCKWFAETIIKALSNNIDFLHPNWSKIINNSCYLIIAIKNSCFAEYEVKIVNKYVKISTSVLKYAN